VEVSDHLAWLVDAHTEAKRHEVLDRLAACASERSSE
jgi:hypothetical protein